MRIVGSLLLALVLTSPLLAVAQQPPALSHAMPVSAVVSALADRSVAVSSDRIHLPSSIISTVPEPSLRLVAAELRNDDSLSLRLACRTGSECLPFFAVVSMPNHADALAALETLRSINPVPSTQHGAGITVGSRVTLELSDRQMQIRLQGIAIDNGEPGHDIRVASLDRKHTYHGVVLGPDTVKGDLP